MLYSIKTFGGMLPRIEPRLLQESNAQNAVGTKLRSGALVPFNSPKVVKGIPKPADTYQTLYQYEHTDGDMFLVFEDDVDIVKGPVANDEYNRTYITGLDKPRAFDTTQVDYSTDITINSTNSFELAISSGAAATLAVSGVGTGELVSRAYVYTYIRTWPDTKFDEGAPSAPAQDGSGNDFVDVEVGQTVTMSNIADPPSQGATGVDRIAIYRVVTGTTGSEYQLVIDFDIADAKAGSVADVTWDGTHFTYSDTKLDEELGEVLESTTWAAPSDGLQGLISLRNGCLVAFEDNVIHFSEPYQMHAWPTSYRVTLDYNIVGLGAFGNTVVALTERFPFLINAQNPTVLIPQPTQSTAPCTSKRGIVNYENVVYFPAPDGLMAVASDGIRNVTQAAFTSAEWVDYAPTTFESAIQDGRYFGFYENTETNSTGFVILDLEEKLGAVSTELYSAASFYVDKRTDTLYFINNDPSAGWIISEWEGIESPRTLTWRSKKFTTQQGLSNLAGCRVRAMFLTAAELKAINEELEKLAEEVAGDLNGAVNETELDLLTFNGDAFEQFRAAYRFNPLVTVRYYVDGALKHTQDVITNMPFRLPAGFPGTWFEVEVESNLPIYQLDLATSMQELR